jgi:hypothetical protein
MSLETNGKQRSERQKINFDVPQIPLNALVAIPIYPTQEEGQTKDLSRPACENERHRCQLQPIAPMRKLAAATIVPEEISPNEQGREPPDCRFPEQALWLFSHARFFGAFGADQGWLETQKRNQRNDLVGFEPCFEGRCSVPLSYGPVKKFITRHDSCVFLARAFLPARPDVQ